MRGSLITNRILRTLHEKVVDEFSWLTETSIPVLNLYYDLSKFGPARGNVDSSTRVVYYNLTKVQPAHGNVDSSITLVLQFNEIPAGSRIPLPKPAESSPATRPIRTAPQRESDSTRTIPAEGSQFSLAIRTAPQRERFDTHDPRRGLESEFQNSHGATTGAMRHARSPQRVRIRVSKFARRHNESDATRTIPAEGSNPSFKIRTAPQRERCDAHDPRRGCAPGAIRRARNPQRFRRRRDQSARRHKGSHSTRTIPAEGSQFSFEICTAPQRERFDTHDPRRGSESEIQNSHGATKGAMRHARNPQKVQIRASKFARRHNGSDATCTIPAEGSNPSLKIRTAPQRERRDMHDPRRGLESEFQNSYGATTGAMRRARSPQRVRIRVSKFARRHNGSDATRTKPAEGALRPFYPGFKKREKTKGVGVASGRSEADAVAYCM